ncbi:hypothetical protein L4D76_16635, partial [Photobacterium sagamiensis]|uniref:hypothetical protein n=1 Tax=Photobacterium sagamiensis TaxID=2910241 RepID=UPI003D0BE57A
MITQPIRQKKDLLFSIAMDVRHISKGSKRLLTYELDFPNWTPKNHVIKLPTLFDLYHIKGK